MRPVAALLLLLLPFAALCQDKREQARAMVREAIEMMENGRIDEAIAHLRKAEKLDPGRHVYPYEIGFAHQLRKDYKKAAPEFRRATRCDDATDQCWQMLGNVLDLGGDPAKAHEAYDEGLKRFPNSGRLHMEKGTMFHQKGQLGEAAAWYEKGIAAEPMYPTNYHRLAVLFLSTEEVVWGMIYGELLINLERSSARAAQLSKLLFDTYKRAITFPTDSSAAVSFSRRASMPRGDELGPDGQPRMPFALAGYELPLMLAVGQERAITLESLDRIRARFLDAYYEQGHDRTWPNALFAYQRKAQQAGHLSAYNHWVLMKGDEAAFEAWRDAHADQWRAFVDWFLENRLALDGANRFIRTEQ